MRGRKRPVFYALVSEAISRCIPKLIKMSAVMGRAVIRQHSPVPFSNSCRRVCVNDGASFVIPGLCLVARLGIALLRTRIASSMLQIVQGLASDAALIVAGT